MDEGNQPFLTFENLEAYQAARNFRVALYAVARKLPDFEKYDLAGQIRTAAVSLTNNIAEGHGRFHYADQIKFMLQARGSLEELLDDVNVCADEQYISATEAAALKREGLRVGHLLNGYLRHLRKKLSPSNLLLRETPLGYQTESASPLFPDALPPLPM